MFFDLRKSTSYRVAVKVFLDLCTMLAAWCVSFLIRFPTDVTQHLLESVSLLPLFISIQLVCFALFKQYASMWRYSDLHLLESLIKAATLGTALIISATFFVKLDQVSRSIMLLNWLLVIFFSGGIRFSVRRLFTLDHNPLKKRSLYKRTLIYGAGQAGELLLRNIENNKQVGMNVVGLIDDDPTKHGLYIHRKQVIGDRTKIGELVKKHKINNIILSIPSLSGIEVRDLLSSIRGQIDDEVEIKSMPGLTDIIEGRITINDLHKLEIKDLLRRKPVHLDFEPVKGLIQEKTILVVGGGGSIGTELCLQIASFGPKCLVILDNCEYNLYRAEAVVSEKFPDLNLVCLVGDACIFDLMKQIFERHHPAIVFHAAAYKHVPLMETNPWAAVSNNLTSTLVLVRMCRDFDVERFIFVSTDKAVQPTSIMGVTKRVCEQISLQYKDEGSTRYLIVRFGNVLGSSGSVIPKFKAQVESGGPITVTHRKVTRYFMLISEAVELVLQAGAIGESGNIYVLEMGEPINITELAQYMVELSGLKLNEDIKIIYTGLRPGEKLHESLYLEGEERSTDVPNILVLTPKETVDNLYLRKVKKLLAKLYEYDHIQIRAELKSLVPEYMPSDVSSVVVQHAEGQQISKELGRGATAGIARGNIELPD